MMLFKLVKLFFCHAVLAWSVREGIFEFNFFLRLNFRNEIKVIVKGLNRNGVDFSLEI